MASESSELTFVRCPSCRSLVPVSASRCRICNNPLDGGGKAAEGDAAKQGGRVRQKTISSTADELMHMEEEPARSVPSPVVPVTTQSQPSFGDDGDHEEVDPLADFLQEFEAEAESDSVKVGMTAPPPPKGNPVAAANDDNDDDEFDSFLDELDSYDSSVEAPAPKPQAIPVAPPVVEPPIRSFEPERDTPPLESNPDPLANFMTTEDDFDLDIAPQPVGVVAPPERQYAPEPPPPPPPPVRQAPPRPQVEKGPPPQQQQPQKQQAQQQPAKQARPVPEQKGQRDHRPSAPHNERRDHVSRDREEPRRAEHRGEDSRKSGNNGGGRPQERSPERQHERAAARPEARPEAQSAGPKTGKMRPGRLFGWLVSFESPDGRAIELREGKFFVTGSSIRGTDLVIEDASISTPHALMSVSADNGFLIQDLMSERGVFVRPGDRGQYKREDGIVELKHGDWVRFGDVEFLVTVVPSGK